MSGKTCLACGADISSRHGNAKYCGVDCGGVERTDEERRDCAKRSHEHYHRNRENILAARRARYMPGSQSQYRKVRGKAARFGISEDRLKELLGAGCQICGAMTSAGRNSSLVIDHDHNCCPGIRCCGKCVRGALCRQCNSAIGFLNDDPELVARAAKYLQA